MARPKGSKNKNAAKNVLSVEEIDAQIAAATEEIETLTSQLKARKAELKALNKSRAEAEQLAAAEKAAADQAAIMAAVAASGKSTEEILELLK